MSMSNCDCGFDVGDPRVTLHSAHCSSIRIPHLEQRVKELYAENARLRDKALTIGKAFMADTPFDTYHGIDIHETASDYAEWDGRPGEILPMDYFDALVRCCKESQALLGGVENG